MTKAKDKIFLLSILLSILLCTTSCMTTKTTVGTFKESPAEEYTYAKGKQVWLFWGLVPLGRTNVNTPNSGNCEIITKFRFGDFLITSLTGGIISSYSIKVKAKKEGYSSSDK